MHPDPPSALELSYSVFVSSRFSGNIRGRNVGVQRRSVGFAWPKTLPAGHVIRIQTSFIILWERLDNDDLFSFLFSTQNQVQSFVMGSIASHPLSLGEFSPGRNRPCRWPQRCIHLPTSCCDCWTFYLLQYRTNPVERVFAHVIVWG